MRTGWQRNWVRTVTTLMTAAVMVMIFLFSMENAEKSDKRSGVISQTVVEVIHPEYADLKPEQQKHIFDSVQHVVRKCAHFTEYMILGFMIRLCLESWIGHRMKKSRWLVLIGFGAGAAYACSDEIHQLAIDGRSGQMKDVFVDCAGVLAGVAIGTVVVNLVNRRNAENVLMGKNTDPGE